MAVIRNLYLLAMALFMVTVIIGILNGLDLVEFDRNQLLTHVHAGTLGWITLGVVASAFWMFGRTSAPLAVALGLAIPAYVLAFYTGSLPARAITGVVLLAMIGWLLVWVWRAWLADRSLPGLAIALALTTFAYGSLTGVLLQVQIATNLAIFPGGADVVGAHASTMVFSYLILVAMGLVEWRVAGATRPTAAGLVQLFGLFGGGLLIVVTLLFLPGAVQQMAGLYLVLTLAAIGVFVVRILLRTVRTADWIAAEPTRYLAASSLYVILTLAIFLGLVVSVMANPAGDLPGNILIASDHAAFVGVMTNLLFGLTLILAAERRRVAATVDQLVFWALNAGLVVFLVGLITDTALLKQIGAPFMGAAILLGLVAIAARLREPAPALPPEGQPDAVPG